MAFKMKGFSPFTKEKHYHQKKDVNVGGSNIDKYLTRPLKPGEGQPKGGTAPKKKTAQSTKSVQSGPKKKKLKNLDDKFIKTKKSGFLKDKTGKRVTRLSKEELMKRRKAQR